VPCGVVAVVFSGGGVGLCSTTDERTLIHEFRRSFAPALGASAASQLACPALPRCGSLTAAAAAEPCNMP